MTFQEAERAYQDLKAQYSSGKLSSTDFETEVSKLKVQDPEGHWWQIGVQSGDWYLHDGQRWIKSQPPVSTPKPVVPASAPEPTVTAPPSSPSTPPIAAGPVAAVPPASPPPTPPPGKSTVTPRFFSAAPAGRGGPNLPRPLLIGIAALVAFIGIGIIIAAFLFLSGQLAGNQVASATATPTTVVAVLPSPSLPTLAPPPATNTPILLPTAPVVITPTVAITPTTAPVTTTTGPRPTTGATATRRPATPTSTAPAAATKAPAVAPGVYVTRMRLDPPAPNFGEPFRFHVTFLNNTGAPGPSSWIVKIFKCNAECTGQELSVSIGETPRVNQTILPGTTELVAGPWAVGLGSCNFVATPYYVDGLGNVIPFPTTSGPRMYFDFKMCR